MGFLADFRYMDLGIHDRALPPDDRGVLQRADKGAGVARRTRSHPKAVGPRSLRY